MESNTYVSSMISRTIIDEHNIGVTILKVERSVSHIPRIFVVPQSLRCTNGVWSVSIKLSSHSHMRSISPRPTHQLCLV